MNAATSAISTGPLSVTGNILMTAGAMGNGGAITQTGTGTFDISGTGVVDIGGSTLTTNRPVTVSNLNLTGFQTGGTITTTSTVSFALGTYPSSSGPVHFHAAGFDFAAGTTVLQGFELTQTGGTTTIPVGSSVTMYEPTLAGGTLEVDGTLNTGGPLLRITGGTLTGTGTIVGPIENDGRDDLPRRRSGNAD